MISGGSSSSIDSSSVGSSCAVSIISVVSSSVGGSCVIFSSRFANAGFRLLSFLDFFCSLFCLPFFPSYCDAVHWSAGEFSLIIHIFTRKKNTSQAQTADETHTQKPTFKWPNPLLSSLPSLSLLNANAASNRAVNSSSFNMDRPFSRRLRLYRCQSDL